MNTEPQYYGTLVRVYAAKSDLVLVVEKAEDSSFWTLRPSVTEIRVSGPGTGKVEMSLLEDKLGDAIWLTEISGKVILEGDFFEPRDLGPCHVETHEREHNTDDLRQKFLTLSKAFKSAEEATGKQINKLHSRQEALEKFLTGQQHNLRLKQEFFAVKDRAKAREITAQLDVMAEVARIMKER